MKKLIALLLVAAFVTISAVGCGSGETKSTTSKGTGTGAATPSK